MVGWPYAIYQVFSMAPLHEWSMFESQHVGWAYGIWACPAMGYPKTSWLRSESISLSDQSRTGDDLGYPTLLQDVTCPAFCTNPKAIWLTCINPSNQMMMFKSYNNMFKLVRFECSNVKPYHVIPFHTMPYQWSSPVLTWFIHPIHYQYVYKFMLKL